MPWSNNKSPWDGNRSHASYNNQKIKNDKKFNERPPDFDDFLKKGKYFIKKIGSNGIIFFAIVIGIIFWLMQCFYIVEQNEQTVELRFGKPKNAIITDGLHFHLWPIDTYKKVSRTEQTATVGTRNQEGLMLSGDQNIVHVDFSVYYYIVDPTAYLFNVNDQEGTIRQVAESAMREVVGRRPADDVYRKQREAVANEVTSIIQSTLNKYGVGVDVTRVSITEAAPPHEVASAFNSVQQAEQERNRAIEQGNQERAKKRGSANGEASRIREEAAAYKEKTVEEALGEAKRFSLIAKEARISPEATRLRIYIEAFEKLLSSPGKLIIEKSSGTVLQHLPLNEFLSSSKIMKNKNFKEGNK